MSNTWQDLGNHPLADVMLLLPDGRVMAWENMQARYRFLTPGADGGYASGVWSSAHALTGDTHHGAAVMRDGNVFKFDGPNAQIFATESSTWAVRAALPSAVTGAGVASTLQIMANGKAMLETGSNIYNFYNPSTDSWLTKSGGEVIWPGAARALLPGGNVLTFTDDGSGRQVAYAGLKANGDTFDATTTLTSNPVQLNCPCVLLPSGRILIVDTQASRLLFCDVTGGGTSAAISIGPSFPAVDDHGLALVAVTRSMCLLPNGHVLCGAEYSSGALPDGTQNDALVIYEVDPTLATPVFVPQESPSFRHHTAVSAAHLAVPRRVTFLVLPQGGALVSAKQSPTQARMRLYALTGAPDPAWRPILDAYPDDFAAGLTFTLGGRQLNGLSQAASHLGSAEPGDSSTFVTQNATNYPLVQFTADGGATFRYLRTFAYSSMGVATGPVAITLSCAAPADLPVGPGQIRVVTNGIPSELRAVEVTA